MQAQKSSVEPNAVYKVDIGSGQCYSVYLLDKRALNLHAFKKGLLFEHDHFQV